MASSDTSKPAFPLPALLPSPTSSNQAVAMPTDPSDPNVPPGSTTTTHGTSTPKHSNMLEIWELHSENGNSVVSIAEISSNMWDESELTSNYGSMGSWEIVGDVNAHELDSERALDDDTPINSGIGTPIVSKSPQVKSSFYGKLSNHPDIIRTSAAFSALERHPNDRKLLAFIYKGSRRKFNPVTDLVFRTMVAQRARASSSGEKSQNKDALSPPHTTGGRIVGSSASSSFSPIPSTSLFPSSFHPVAGMGTVSTSA